MNPRRRLAGCLMLASSVTHLSELFFFPIGPVTAVVVFFGVAFFAIGIHLLRPGDRVLFWGALLPLTAAFLGIGSSILQGGIHPITVWHLFVDLTAGPICLLQWRSLARSKAG